MLFFTRLNMKRIMEEIVQNKKIFVTPESRSPGYPHHHPVSPAMHFCLCNIPRIPNIRTDS